jgi:membrane associated rhomboid family serine protease
VLPLKDNIPTRRFPVVTVAIIAICCFVYFVLEKGGLSGPSDAFVVKYGAIPYEIKHAGVHCALIGHAIACGKHGAPSQPATWLTVLYAMFLHGSLLHIGGNMLFLWIFGNNVEDSMGRGRFVLFYLLGGVVATLVQVAATTGSDAAVPTLGASGAIAAVLGAYAVLYPRARVLTVVFIIIFFTVIELPALLVLVGWFLLQVASASSQTLGGGGVAYFAHIGGFVFGLLTIKLFANRAQDDYDSANRIPVY